MKRQNVGQNEARNGTASERERERRRERRRERQMRVTEAGWERRSIKGDKTEIE